MINHRVHPRSLARAELIIGELVYPLLIPLFELVGLQSVTDDRDPINLSGDGVHRDEAVHVRTLRKSEAPCDQHFI